MKKLCIKIILLILHTFLFSQYFIFTYHIKTPNNTSVENTVYFNGVEDVESLAQEIVELIDFYNNDTITTHVVLNQCTHKYNCHGYAWHISEGGDLVWIGITSTFAENIYWQDNSYITITDESLYSEATKISYGECGFINHIGVYIDPCDHSAVMTNEPGIVISKWGNKFLLKHPINDHPYKPIGSHESIINYYHHNSPAFCYILDISGSMAENGKLENAKLAIKQNIAMQNYGIDMGIVTFSTTAQVFQNRIRLLQNEDKTNLINNINNIQIDSTTSIGAGLQTAHSLMQSSLRSEKIYILLSDGLENTEPYINQVSYLFSGNNNIVHTIALGENANQDKMASLATSTGGKYHYIEDLSSPIKILKAYYDILNSSNNNDVFYSTEVMSSPGSMFNNTFQISEDTKEFSATILCSNPSSQFNINLTLPNLDVITPENHQDYIYNNGEYKQYGGYTYTYGPGMVKVKVVNPIPGDWEINVNTSSFYSTSYSLGMEIKDNTSFEIDIQENNFHRTEPVIIKVQANDGANPITNAIVNTSIELPDGSLFNLELYDNGLNYDEIANDGIYSGSFNQTEIVGSYNLNCEFYGNHPSTSNEFNRFENFSFYIFENPNEILGCTDPLASNYNPEANWDDGFCLYLVHHVSPNGDDEIADGTIEFPYATIQSAINASNGPDTLVIHPGVYNENLNITMKNLFLTSTPINSNVEFAIENTIINGNNLGSVIEIDRSEIKIAGITIINGDSDNGGGLKITKSKVELENSVVFNNSAIDGGALYSFHSEIEINNSTITDNNSINGGAVYCAYSSEISILNSILWNNNPQQIFCSQEYPANNFNIRYSNIQGGLDELILNTGSIIYWDYNLDLNPLFNGLSDIQYTLSQNSPMIDAGFPGGDPILFFDLDETPVDLGAFYFHQLNGDVNLDAEITISDLLILVEFVLEGILLDYNQVRLSDLNSDNSHDVIDILILIEIILEQNINYSNPELTYISGTLEAINNGENYRFIIDMLNLQDVYILYFKLQFDNKIPLNVVKGSRSNDMTVTHVYKEDDYTLNIMVYSPEGRKIPSGYGIILEIELESTGLSRDGELTDGSEFIVTDLANNPESLIPVEIVSADELSKLADEKLNQLIPDKFALHPVYPNPFNPTTTIKYDIPKESHISIKVFDLSGRSIETLVYTNQGPGMYSFEWNAEHLSSGAYFIKLETKEFTQNQKLMLVK